MPRSRGWTPRDLDEAGVSVSRLEERHALGWLGRAQRDPADLPESAWNDDRQPSAREEAHRGDADR